MRRRLVFVALAAIAVACDSSSSPNSPDEGSGPHPIPSSLGSLTVRPDTGSSFVVGRQLRLVVRAADANGVAADASNTEVTSANPAIAQWVGAITVPATNPPAPYVNALVVTFDLQSVGSTAIRARLGIFVDSTVITVIPPM